MSEVGVTYFRIYNRNISIDKHNMRAYLRDCIFPFFIVLDYTVVDCTHTYTDGFFHNNVIRESKAGIAGTESDSEKTNLFYVEFCS